MQGSDPGSGSGRTDQDTPLKGDDNPALTDEDLQMRRIKVSLVHLMHAHIAVISQIIMLTACLPWGCTEVSAVHVHC